MVLILIFLYKIYKKIFLGIPPTGRKENIIDKSAISFFPNFYISLKELFIGLSYP